MVDKNPYENDETVDIPDFAKKAKEEDVDMSVFKLPKNDDKDGEEEEYDDEEYYDDEDYQEGPHVSKAVIVIAVVVLLLLAGAAAFGLIWGSNQKKAAATAEQEVTTLKTENAALTAQVTELETQVAELQKKQSGTGTGSGTGSSTTSKNYTITVDSIKIREGAGTSYDQVEYEDLPDTLKGTLVNNDGYAMAAKDKTVTVLETKVDGNNTWGKLADNVWVCLIYEGTAWATAAN